MIGQTISHYHVTSKLGAGGMGEVYLAQDTKLDRKVAIKILTAEVASDRGRMSRFVQEAKAASALNHPNILTIYEIDQANSVHFIATEFIDGETLRQRMKSAPLKLGDVLDVTAQIASALSAAHAAGIVHRDIKPENTMLRRDGIAKVLDFGLAKLTERLLPGLVDTEAPTSFKTDPGTVVGTAVYMSPEQARGITVDARTDVFSLGVVLYEMVAGCLPFAGSTSSEVLASILSDREPPPLARYSREVPGELERIVSKALRKEREQRYQTVKDLMLDLQTLKQQLEFEAKLERSMPPELKSATSGTTELATVETITRPTAHSSSEGGSPTGEVKFGRRWVIPAAAVLILAAATAAYFFFLNRQKASINSLAVLPFVNVSNDPNTEYLSDGITESLINNLSQLPNLKMIARSSVFRYKGKEVDPRTVGHELSVQVILMGRVVQRGDQLSISAELVDAQNNTHLWGEQYQRKASDLLDVQREIAQEISSNLRLKLSSAEQGRVIKRYTENPEAYQLYLKGRYFWNKRSEESLKKAVEFFNQALEKDRNYALAYAGLADCYTSLTTYNYGPLPPEVGFPQAKEMALQALKIDESLAEAHASLATVHHWYEQDNASAEREFKRALELNPNYAAARLWYATYLLEAQRDDEAFAEIKRAHELDPLSLVINANVAQHYYFRRDYDRAIEQMFKTIEIDPNSFIAHKSLAYYYEKKGMYEEAIKAARKAVETSGDGQYEALVARNYALSGRREQARKILRELMKLRTRRFVSPTLVALVYEGLGEVDQAFVWLEKAHEERDVMIRLLKRDPIFDGLRSDPRFAELVRRIGLPQ